MQHQQKHYIYTMGNTLHQTTFSGTAWLLFYFKYNQTGQRHRENYLLAIFQGWSDWRRQRRDEAFVVSHDGERLTLSNQRGFHTWFFSNSMLQLDISTQTEKRYIQWQHSPCYWGLWWNDAHACPLHFFWAKSKVKCQL